MSKKPSTRARVVVYPRPEILDPEGKAIAGALRGIGFEKVSEVRVGKSLEIALEGVEGDRATAMLKQMCERLLANTVIEDYSIELLAAGAPAGAAP